MINISICLTDLPKNKITVSEKNGKKYINIVCDKRKEPSAYGETHTIYVQQTKEERETKIPKQYCGSGKEIVFENKTQSTLQPAKDDLPW